MGSFFCCYVLYYTTKIVSLSCLSLFYSCTYKHCIRTFIYQYWKRANALLKLRGGEDSLGLSEGAEGESTSEEIKRAHEESLRLYKAITECKDGYIAGK